MKKLLIAFLILLSSLKLWAPIPSHEQIAESIVLAKVASISDSIDINYQGIQNIPLQPFVQLYDDITLEKLESNDTISRGKPFIITSFFGMRMHPVLSMYLLHTGIDVAIKKDELILASGDGEIIEVETSKFGYGNYIIIKHNNEFKTLYAHLSKILVKKGDYVSAGTVIGLGGKTGLVSGRGYHVHFELIYNDKKVDPLKFINAKNAKEFTKKMLAIQEINRIIWSS